LLLKICASFYNHFPILGFPEWILEWIEPTMKISGFTFIRNAVKYDFPIVEAISSILPIVDEFIVNVGKSDDGTCELIQVMNEPRIKIIETEWDESLQKDGKIFAIQQDIALSHCSGDWAFLV